MRRFLAVAIPLALAGPLALAVTVPVSADATTTQTSTCTDGGNHVWTGRTVWGGFYQEGDGTHVINNAVSFTTSKASTVDYTVTTYDGSGAAVGTLAKNDLAYDFAGGSRYATVDPRNPRTAPGKAKIVVKIKAGTGGKTSCTMTFTQPGVATEPTPTPSPTSNPTPTPSPAGSTCPRGKEIVTFDGEGSADLAQYGQGSYNASAEEWNVGGYSYDQLMGVCSHDAWYADVTTDDNRGDGAVKAYPSMRRIYHDWSTSDFSKDPLLTSFPRLDVTFGATDPATCPGCIYDTAFDIWLNGIAGSSSNELMIWTHNVGQTPSGTKVASGIKIAGHTWDLWSTSSNHYLAYVPSDTSKIATATFDIRDFTDDLVSRGRLSSSSRLGQLSYGVETVSTNGVARHWDFTKFTVVDR